MKFSSWRKSQENGPGKEIIEVEVMQKIFYEKEILKRKPQSIWNDWMKKQIFLRSSWLKIFFELVIWYSINEGNHQKFDQERKDISMEY